MRASRARAEVAAAYLDLGRRGLIVGSAGNVSLRTRKGMVITPSGGDPASVAPADLVPVTFDGVPMAEGTPSSEWAMHAAIYRSKPTAVCVVHTHSDACTALAALNQALPPFHYMVVRFGGGDVPCAPYVTFGTRELADLTAEALAERSACLLANHGMILHAGTVAAAISDAILLETLCRQYLLARSAGPPHLLSGDELNATIERFKTYGPRRRA